MRQTAEVRREAVLEAAAAELEGGRPRDYLLFGFARWSGRRPRITSSAAP